MAAPPESAFNALAEFEALIVRRPFSSRVDPTSSEITKVLGEEDGYRDWITQRAGIHDRCRLISAKSRPQETLVPTPTTRVEGILAGLRVLFDDNHEHAEEFDLGASYNHIIMNPCIHRGMDWDGDFAPVSSLEDLIALQSVLSSANEEWEIRWRLDLNALRIINFNQPPFNALKYELIVLRYSPVHQFHTFIEPMCLLNQRLPYELYQASLTDGELLPSRGPGLPLPPFDAPPTKRPLKSQVNPFLINIAAFCRIKRHEALEGNDPILLPRYQSLSSSVINLVGLLFWKPGGSNGGALREAGLGDKSLRELMGLLDWKPGRCPHNCAGSGGSESRGTRSATSQTPASSSFEMGPENTQALRETVDAHWEEEVRNARA